MCLAAGGVAVSHAGQLKAERHHGPGGVKRLTSAMTFHVTSSLDLPVCFTRAAHGFISYDCLLSLPWTGPRCIWYAA